MRRHLGLLGMAAALAFMSAEPLGMPRRHVRPPVKKKRRGPLNARLKKRHQLKGVRS